MKKLTFILFLLPFISNLKAQNQLIFGFYNIENLFDTLDDPFKNDNEFLPQSLHRWDAQKYDVKLQHLARVIGSMNNWEGPDILGVCEVEHQSCLNDLIQKTALKKYDYQVIHQESPDERGIDVACIFKKDVFTLIDYQYIRIKFDTLTRNTRDILYIKLSDKLKLDTFHVFYNHWPSRMGGKIQTEVKRIKAAETLKRAVDSVLFRDSASKILILGDFNDTPTDKSISETLKSSSDSLTSYLYNTSYRLYKKGLGTHKFQDEWNLLDQILISNSVRLGVNYSFKGLDSRIHNRDWMNEFDLQNGGNKPKRFYVGTKCNYGYSDHYPVYVQLLNYGGTYED